ncbi:MAG: histidine kinase [Planctomycetota bacterium]|nr:MAG: histidine kinase [Planctomycetota bacterium]
MKKVKRGGGWPAVWYTLGKAREVGGIARLWKAMRSKNTCKTCALGMGGQAGGMVNESGHFPEVCKKSLQAMVADMQGAIQDKFFETYSIPQLQAFSPRELEHCGRLTTPLVADGSSQHYRPISWNEALTRIADKLKQTAPSETFWYASGRSSNEAGFILQLFARLYGTNHVNNCSYYCHQASGVGLTSAVGVGTATITLEDLDKSDLIFVIGGNPASNHPRLLRTLAHARRRGARIIVINPVVETGMVNFAVPSDVRSLLFGSEIASLYVQPHIGGDLALLAGIAKRIDELGATDTAFLTEHCQGWEAYAESLRQLTWEEITAKSGVEQDTIEEIARQVAASKSTVFSWTMGITHHLHGVQNVQAIANLALMRGMVGREGAGLLPIRGHSNVQGMGSVGVTPALKNQVLEQLQSRFGVQVPSDKGLDTMACMEAAGAGAMKFGFCLGGNLYGSNPDANFAAHALGQLDMLVYLSTTLNTGHAHGLGRETIVLPVLARDEEPEPTTQESMFSFVRYSDGGPRRHQGPRSEVEILAEMARRVLPADGPIDWNEMARTGTIRQAIGAVIPGWEQIATMDKSRREFYITGRRLSHVPFPTPDGKARLHVHELPALAVGEEQLRLMTVRSEGQFNTVVYEEYDLYRGQDRRDVILVHPDDLARLGIKTGTRVTAQSEVGSISVQARAYDDIRPGNALMYYPEANVLVPRHCDPASKTPAFKNVLVRLVPAARDATAGDNGDGEAVELPVSASRGNMRAC